MITELDLLANLRQLLYPREFRIFTLPWPPELAPTVEELVRHLRSEDQGLPAPSVNGQVTHKDQVQFLADLATGLWRMRQKMIEPATGQPVEETRRLYRHFESVWDILSGAGVEIHGHTGEPFESGMSLNVITFQPSAELQRELVLETIKPTVYVKDQMVQMGEVVVGVPERPVPKAPAESDAPQRQGDLRRTG